jgi:hypothetical protein
MKSNFYQTRYVGRNTPYETPYYIYKSESAEPIVPYEAGIHGEEIALEVDFNDSSNFEKAFRKHFHRYFKPRYLHLKNRLLF